MAAFISFEGGEGSGKTTQSRLLAEALERMGEQVRLTREPGGEPEAEHIRNLLVNGAANRWDPMAETLLFLAARTQHVKRVIEPALTQNIWPISDRFHDSTRVYQGVGKQINDTTYLALHQQALGNFTPSLTFLMDMPPEIGVKRALERSADETRFESMDMTFHHAVREGFLSLAEAEPERICVLNATHSIEAIHTQIIARMETQFGLSLQRNAV